MARKKRARLTRKKAPSHKKSLKATPNGLSEGEFNALSHDYGSFVVEDSEHDSYTFKLDDAAYILHDGSGESGDVAKDAHWIGKIMEIRGDSPDNVWIRVKWYWSPQEVAEVIKSFDPAVCGTFEKLSSDNFDIVSVHSVVDHVDVKTFDETSIYQEPIGDDEWYARFELRYEAKKINPRVIRHACNICKTPYTPGVEKTLHFCPRPGCCSFYHQACLVKNGYVEHARTRRVLETWPDIDRTASVAELASERQRRKRQKKDRPTSTQASQDPLANFPEELIAIAEQPIVRGTRGVGVVGNITSVAPARQMIYSALIGTTPIPDDWASRIDASTAYPDADTLPNCMCPSCYSPI